VDLQHKLVISETLLTRIHQMCLVNLKFLNMFTQTKEPN